MNCAAEISFARARHSPSAKWCARKWTWTDLMDRAFELSDYHAKTRAFRGARIRARAIKKGIGFAAFLHGAGFTGSGEEYLASEAALEATAEGRVRMLAGSTEMGQGTNTIFAQIAAEALGIECDQIEIVQPDTADVPNSGPTVASRTAMIVGKLVESAARGLLETLTTADCCSRIQCDGFCATLAARIHRNIRPAEIVREIRASARFALGRSEHIRATRMARMRGRFTWRKFRSTCARPRCAWTISSRCRKWAR